MSELRLEQSLQLRRDSSETLLPCQILLVDWHLRVVAEVQDRWGSRSHEDHDQDRHREEDRHQEEGHLQEEGRCWEEDHHQEGRSRVEGTHEDHRQVHHQGRRQDQG